MVKIHPLKNLKLYQYALETNRSLQERYSELIETLHESLSVSSSKKQNVQYNLHLASQFSIPTVRSIFHGTESLSYLRPKIWDIVTEALRELSNLSASKKQLKSGKLKIA